MTTTDMKHICIGWDDEDRAYVYEAAEGEAEGTGRLYEADVPAELMAALEAAEKEWHAAYKAVVDATGYEDGRAKQACESWVGDEYPGKIWYSVVLAESGDPDEWPLRSVQVHMADSPQDAEKWIDALPDEFWLYPGVGHMVHIAKTRLTVERGGYGGSMTSCDRCGWERGEHPESGDSG